MQGGDGNSHRSSWELRARPPAWRWSSEMFVCVDNLGITAVGGKPEVNYGKLSERFGEFNSMYIRGSPGLAIMTLGNTPLLRQTIPTTTGLGRN